MASVVLLPFQLLLLFLLLLQTIAASTRSNLIHPTCKPSCGNVSVPYPFGIGRGCYRDESFEIKCQPAYDGGPVVPFSGSDVPISNFSLLQSQVTMIKYLTYDCYNTSGLKSHWRSGLDLTGSPFAISAARNKFTAIGCNTIAYIVGTSKSYETGCMSYCNEDDVNNNISGSCTGTGCCQAALTENLRNYRSGFQNRSVGDNTWEFNPCSYSFVADQNWFQFNSSYLEEYNFRDKFNNIGVPLVLDWIVGNVTCEEAKTNSSSYACRSSNSTCRDAPHGPGYTCNCSKGYQGNPYLENGCEDIDECSFKDQNPCPQGNICTNTPGSYICSCKQGYQSKDPSTIMCEQDAALPLWIRLTLGIGISIVFLLVLGFWIYMVIEKRKLAGEKQRFLEQNGGLLLYEEIKSKDSRLGASFKIYGKEEMAKATSNFDKNLILGRGGHGTVYKGILEGNLTVAIKKSKMIDESQKGEFVKEILILSQINHKNVVKLLGCCLEVEVPMLVYEFVSSGTLHEYIHGKSHLQFIPLDTRLRIALESAEALAYLHSSASPPILHGDVKSLNILLDENHAAKVSDFGASTLVALNETQLATIIQGTCGYLDPEYMQTYIFTEKSDVYSFGVILLELLTRKMAVDFEGSKEGKSLASTFIGLMKENRLMEVFDDQLINGGQADEGQLEILHEVSELAKQCLSMTGEERPTMKEVAEGLQKIRRLTHHPWEQHKPEELEVLLGESPNYSVGDTTVYYSLETRAAMDIEAGR